MTRHGHLPIRLLAETLLIVALAEAVVMAAILWLAPHSRGWQGVALNAGALVLLAAPTLYWRAMHAVRMSARQARQDEPTAGAGLSREKRRARAISMTGTAQVVGLVLTGAAMAYVKLQIDDDTRQRFERHVERLEAEVLRKFQTPIYGLNGARGIYAANQSVNRAQFRGYVESRDLATEFPGVRGFGFVERVMRSKLDEFAAGVRADGPSDFQVRTGGDAADLYVVKYVEPFAVNFAAWGFDMGSEGVRREAIERSVASGEPSLTGQLTLGQGERKAPGFIYLVPIYRQGADPTTAPQRLKALVGLVYAPMFASDLLSGVVNVTDGALDFELFNGDGTDASQLAFDSDGHLGDVKGVITEAQYSDRLFSAVRTLAIGGRLLTVRTSTSPAFEASVDHRPIAYVGVGGAVLSLFLALVVWALTSARVRALTLAERMTMDLERLAQVVRHTSNAVFITDRDLRIQWINEGFTRISGYDIEAARGKTPGELLGSGKADPAALDRLKTSAANGLPCRVEILNRRRDGREYWVDTEIQPLHDAQGELTGFMEIASDITDKREAHAALQSALVENSALLQKANRSADDLARERQRLDDILSGTNAGTWEWNAQTNVTLINARWADMLGRTLSDLEPLTFATWADLVHPDDLGTAHGALQAHVSGASDHYDCELRMRHRDGHWVWVQTRGRISTRTADGKAEWVAGTHMDISAGKEAESLLRENEHLMRMVTDHISGRIAYWDAKLTLRFGNQAFFDQYGGTPSEQVGRTADAILGADRLRRSAPMIEGVLLGQAQSFERTEVTRAGTTAHQLTHMIPDIRDGEVRGFVALTLDITSIKHAAAELQRTVAMLQTIMDNLPCGLSVFDGDLKLVAHNRQFQELLVLPNNLFEGRKTLLKDVVRFIAGRGEYGPGDIDIQVTEIIERARRPVPYEYERTGSNGTTLDIRGAPMPGGGFVTTYTDVTERKRAEAAVRESEHMMRLVMDSIPGRLTYFDKHRRLTFANKASYDFHGGSPQASFGTSFTDFAGPAAAAQQLEKVDAVLAGQSQTYDFERDMPHGGTAYSVVHLIPDIRDDTVAGFIGMAIDVTAVKRAEQEVRRAEALLRGAIDAINEGFVLFDAEDRLVFCNDKYREIYGTVNDLMVPGASFETLIRAAAERGQHEDAIDRVDEWVTERLAQHRAGSCTMEQQTANGRWLRVIERKMPDGHSVGFRIDITDLKNATSAAEAASRSKSQFLANMSHEIRTPMNAILGMLKLLQRTELTTRQLDYADKTERAARALLGLLNDILDFSKVEAGKMSLDLKPFKLDDLLRDLSVILSANLGAKAVEVLFDVDPHVPAVLVGDDMRLQQVLVNLGGNAIKFTEQGEIVVRVRVLQRDAHRVELAFSVRDTGIGIAPHHQEHIFDGFSQAESSTTRRFGGTGLGLSICQRLVGLMGSRIELESAPGEGSTFRFTIGLQVGPDTGLAHPVPLPTVTRALVVDDNPLARELIAAMAQSLGWTVDLAADGNEAVKLFLERDRREEPYHVVLVDWQMPDIDGWETSRQIRGLSRTRAPLVLMVTAQGREKLAHRSTAEQSLLDGFLVKPVTASMLSEAINHARAAGAKPAACPERTLLAGQSVPAHATRRLNGLRLLVVEDNANNQQVAQELLEAEGAAVMLADDGQLGVAAVAGAATPFDAVLMDVQMPVMDGLTAAGHIRNDLGLRELPIIAMTANAMASDHAASLAAGMNDHVGKPFDLDALVATLLKHVRRHVVPVVESGGPGPASVPVPEDVLQAAQARGIDLASAVRRLGGRLEVWQRTTGSFVKELPGRAHEFDRLMQQARHKDASRLMHTLKGIGATLGAKQLAQVTAAAEHDLAGRSGERDVSSAPTVDAAVIRDVIATTANDLGHLLTLLTASAREGALGADLPRDSRMLRERLQPMMELLKQSDMAATDAFADLLADSEASWEEELRPLSDAMASLDFETALHACEQLLQALPA